MSSPTQPTPLPTVSPASASLGAREDAHGAHSTGTLALALTSAYQLTPREQDETASVTLSLMRSVFSARWHELGNGGLPLPQAATATLQQEARQAAAQAVRTHNQALARFIGEFVATYVTSHHGDDAGIETALADALSGWADKLAAWKPAQIAGSLTRRALSLADLYVGGPNARYLVDGPELTGQSCGTCRTYYRRVLTPQQAWQLLFPAHPGCEHVVRLLTAQELRDYRDSGALPA